MSITIKDLTVNYLTNPLGIDEIPRFSWKLAQDGRGNKQRSYRIKVMTGGKVVWDSKNVRSDESVLIEYKGKKLLPRTTSLECRVTDKKVKEHKVKMLFDTGKWKKNGSANIYKQDTECPENLRLLLLT